METQERKEDIEKIAQALRRVFGENLENGRFIDTTKIPFICKDIEGIHTLLKDMKDENVTKDQFWPVKTLVYGITALLLTGVIGALMTLTFK